MRLDEIKDENIKGVLILYHNAIKQLPPGSIRIDTGESLSAIVDLMGVKGNSLTNINVFPTSPFDYVWVQKFNLTLHGWDVDNNKEKNIITLSKGIVRGENDYKEYSITIHYKPLPNQ